MTVPGEPPASQYAAAVRATGLRKTYGTGETAVSALDGVDVAFARGAFTAIMGPSGSGKSTLMHCLAGLDMATGGQVWLGDTELTSLRDDQLTRLRRERIGFVFQSFNLLPVLDARENILLPLQLAGQRPDSGWFDAVVGRLGLRDRLRHRPYELSGGQQQRVAVARAVGGNPSILLADEPTGNLDSTNGESVMNLLRELHAGGATVCMVTHDPRYARYADRTFHLFDGQVVEETHEAKAEEVLEESGFKL
jgi:putative ABC transport system ATP-binding protein